MGEVWRQRRVAKGGRTGSQLKTFANKKKSYNSDKILCACIFPSYIIELFIVITIIFEMGKWMLQNGPEQNHDHILPSSV